MRTESEEKRVDATPNPGGKDLEHPKESAGIEADSAVELRPAIVVGPDDHSKAEQLAAYEKRIEASLPHYAEAAEALLEIQTRKLYRLVHKTFGAYVRERWRLSRSRAYQLIRFAHERRLSTMVDKPPPPNERQVRISSPPTESEDLAYVDTRAALRFMNRVNRSFQETPDRHRWDFVQILRNMVQVYESALVMYWPHLTPSSPSLQNEPTGAEETGLANPEQAASSES